MVISHVFCNNVAIFMGDFLQLGQLYLSLKMLDSNFDEFFSKIEFQVLSLDLYLHLDLQ